MLGKAANAYAQGYRLSNDCKSWTRADYTDPNSKAGLDATVKRIADAFTPLPAAERAQYTKLFGKYDPVKYDAEKKAWEAAGAGPAQPQPTTTQQVAPSGAPPQPIRRPAPMPGLVPENPLGR